MDAVAPLRDYLFQKQVHDYSEQAQGQDYKRCLDAVIVGEDEVHRSKASLYRPNTKKGDPRIWFRGLKSYVDPDEMLAIVAHGNMLHALNLSNSDFQTRAVSDHTFSSVLSELRPSRKIGETAQELLSKLRNISRRGFIHAECSGSTAIGRTLETALGIPMNSRQDPDYKGIELKTKRTRSGTRHSLFAQVPDWNLSSLKSMREFLDAYGYDRNGFRRLNCTVNALSRNPQGLQLAVEYGPDLLLENGFKDGELDKSVLVWALPSLRKRLVEKHKETFWVSAETRMRNGREEFLFTHVEYTRSPRAYQFSDLLATGLLTVDHEIKAVGKGAKERGPAFKANKAGHKLLFPSPIRFDLA